MGTTDKSDKPNKDQVDAKAETIETVEEAEIVEETSAEEMAEATPEDGATEDAGVGSDDTEEETPVEISEPDRGDADEIEDATPDDSGSEVHAKDASDTPEEVTPVVQDAPEPERKGGFVPMVLGGVVAAVIGFGGAVYFGDQLGLGANTDAALENMAAQLAVQNDTLQSLQDKQGGTADLAEGAQTAADTAVAEVGKLNELLSAYTAELGAVSEAVATLEARLTDIEKRPLNEGLGAAAIAAYEREVKDLKELVAAQKAEAAELKDKADLSAKAALARSSVTRIVAALESGAPYRAAIVDLRSATGDGVASVLEDHADTGVVTLSALIESYPEAARAALAKAREDKVDADSGSKLGNFLKTQFGARSVEAREGSDTDAVLSRAEAALKAGELNTALGIIETLAEGPKTVMADWVAQAQTRAAATQAAEDLAQTLNSN